jgi:pimeloyl-ACP methyl ester carboxylesterase
MARIATNGIELEYDEVGSGYPVVFSHEFGGDRRSWEPQTGYLARWYRCVAYNHRGFPPSSVPEQAEAYSQDVLIDDLRGLLDGLGIERAHMVGLSMGGNVVLNFALRHPERCRSIVVAGTGSGTVDAERWHAEMTRNAATLASDGMAAFVATYARGASRLQLARKDPGGYQRFVASFLEHSALGSRLTIENVILKRPTIFALKARLNTLRVPTLLITGDEDEPCVEPHLFMKREIPDAGLLMLPNTGHTINLEEPQLFNHAVLEFFHGVEQLGGRASEAG